jgi:hypothetical protein
MWEKRARFFDVLIRFVCDSHEMCTISYVEACCSNGYLNRWRSRGVNGLAEKLPTTRGPQFFGLWGSVLILREAARCCTQQHDFVSKTLRLRTPPRTHDPPGLRGPQGPQVRAGTRQNSRPLLDLAAHLRDPRPQRLFRAGLARDSYAVQRRYRTQGAKANMLLQEPGTVIHILWEGPCTIRDIAGKNGPTDKGLYQVYAHHPVYRMSLVYIGSTCTTFADRIPKHQWETGSENDPNNVEYYLGRLRGAVPIARDLWDASIIIAESLLIHAHAPAYNTTFIKEPPSKESCGNARVLSWGAVRSLQREVSGLMWTAKGMDFRGYNAFSA